MVIFCLNGNDDNGDWTPELYSTFNKAQNALDRYVKEINMMYGDYNEETDEYSSVCNVIDEISAEYDCGSHYGEFWIEELEVK